MPEDKQDDSRAGFSLREVAGIAQWALLIVSLVLNLVIIQQLLLARQVARQGVSDAIAVLEGFRGQVFEYTFVVDNTIALDTELPVRVTIPVRLRQDIDIDTTVTVPVNTRLFGVIDLDVPIKTTIPIDLTANVDIDEVFPVNAAVPVYIEQPVSIAVADTPLSGTISEVQQRLIALEASLGGSPFSALPPALQPNPTD
ncbi:MAG: hypothetical protein IT326_00975 [Anaerolineae bacterium]|nr:hypothetical protein [Anaerolineae bacterium]